MHGLLLFIDGLGLGNQNADNPLVTASMPVMRKLLGGHSLVQEGVPYYGEYSALFALDACLDVPGLPQSATGQTALFTGINAAQVMDGHVSAFPGPKLKSMLDEQSILKQLTENGCLVTSANAYVPDYYALINARKRRHSATTLAILAANIELRLDAKLLRSGLAVCHDLTNELQRQLGYTAPFITPEEAGRNLAKIVKQYDFTLFEYFQTDMAGHSKNRELAERRLEELDTCIGGLLSELDLAETLIILTSDHGNIEDLSVKTHTRNPVPCLLIGNYKELELTSLSSITDVTPFIMKNFPLGS